MARHINARDNGGKGPSRNLPEIASRTFHGVETYLFTCNLDSTTIRSLRSSLFIEGLFPYDAELTLLRENRGSDAFDDEDNTLANVLSRRLEGSNVDLQLQVNSSDDMAGDLEAQALNRPFIYKPRNAQSIAVNGLVDPAFMRRANVISGRAAPTFGERWQVAREFSEALEKAFWVDGGKDVLRPYKKGVKSTSGAEILENLREVMEAEAGFLEAMGVGDDNLVDGNEDRVLEEVAGSHMAELYRRV